MKLIYFKGETPNFGDELNPYLWNRILPDGFLDEDNSQLFLGIGSILHKHGYPAEAIKNVVGSGYAGYGEPPEVNDGTWNILFVRGPRTAEKLGLPPEKAIADTAILLRTIELPEPDETTKIAFMPHYESLDRGFWENVCALAGIKLINPTHDIEYVIRQIRGTELLITEAMHGAIVADALRTPWICAKPIYQGHHAKWLDWADALSLELRQTQLWPSSVTEMYIYFTSRGSHDGAIGKINRHLFTRPINTALTHSAAARLTAIAKLEPQLSQDIIISTLTERAKEAVFEFV